MDADSCKLIESLEHDWRDALCARDIGKLRSLVHPSFVLIGTRSGEPFMMNRDEWLEAIQKRDVKAIDLKVRDATVFPDAIVGTVEARWQVQYLGRTIEDCVLLTDVWVCENDRWQAVRRHSSPLPASACG